MRFIDLTGQRFGRLIAITRVFRNKQTHWECQCDCGRKATIVSQSLRCGITTSCGCDRKYQGRKPLPPGVAAFNSLFLDYKWSAKSRDLEFILTKDEFRSITKSRCHYCDCEPTQVKKKGKHIYLYNGIDRVDNNIGYTKENCIPCCMVHNYMKGTLTQQEFLAAVFGIVNHLK